MLRIPLRMIACVREPGQALGLWKGLQALAQSDVCLKFARCTEELNRSVRQLDPHLLLLEVADTNPPQPSLAAVLELAPRAMVILVGEQATLEREGLDRSLLKRVVLWEELDPSSSPEACAVR